MKKLVAVGFLLGFNLGEVIAQVNCYGVPLAVKAGEYGAQEDFAIVTIGNHDYRLGSMSASPAAKYRVSLAATAMTSGRPLLLRFFYHSNCAAASEERVEPNSVQLLSQ
jgi:hypothetical protein